MNIKRIIISGLLALGITGTGAREGLLNREKRPTDGGSETQAINDARSIYSGNHRYGIVNYTHYPNGPSYMLLLPLSIGQSDTRDFRVVPVIFSAICLGVLSFGVMTYASSWILMLVGAVSCLSLLWQPGILFWMGALHEHSYALVLCFAAMGLSLLPNLPKWLLFFLSFISGWIGYDFTFCFILSVLVCRLLVHAHTLQAPVKFLRRSFIDGCVTIAGILAAIITHIIQNALFFGGLRAALADLFGSAAVRAGLSVGDSLNPSYSSYIHDAAAGKQYPRMDQINDIATLFITPTWSDGRLALGCFGLVGICILLGLFRVAYLRLFRLDELLNKSLFYIAVFCLALISGFAWFLLMPEHSRFHFHFIARHLFVPFCLVWLVLFDIAVRLFCLNRAGKTRSIAQFESKTA
jgi:hypothetical protein